MPSSLVLPGGQTLDKLFGHDQKCNVLYGLEPCPNRAQWKVIMACCGGSDFLCNECFADASDDSKPRESDPTKWFACGMCGKSHRRWRDGISEARRMR